MNNNKHAIMDNTRQSIRALLGTAIGIIWGMAIVLPCHAQIAVRGTSSVSTYSIESYYVGQSEKSVDVSPPGAPVHENQIPFFGSGVNWSLRANDLLLAYVVTLDVAASASPYMSSGWTLLSQGIGPSGVHQAAIFWKRATASEINPRVFYSGGGFITAGVIAYRGVDLVSPFDVANSFTSSPDDFTTEAASITTNHRDRILFASLRSAPSAAHRLTGNWSSGEWQSNGKFGFTVSYPPSSPYYHKRGLTIDLFSQMATSGTQPARTLTSSIANAESHGALMALRNSGIPSIAKPAGTVTNDVMVATLAVRGPDSLAVTAPSGWTLVRRIADAGKGVLEVYIRTAGPSEPSAYTWAIDTQANTDPVSATLSMTSFSGVDPTNPIDVEAGQNTANGLTHATPSVTTTIANTMLVTSYASNNLTSRWTPPSGLTEVIDIAPDDVDTVAAPISGLSMGVSYGIQTASGATGVKTATIDGSTTTTGHAHILVLRPAATSRLYFIHTDHLSTPRLITSDAGQTVWQWNNDDPYGNNAPNENPSGAGNFTCNLRLPGQYFDKETNLHYNYFRDYDPLTGRYVQSDPIGLSGGINTYRYVDDNPLQGIDHLGLTNFYQKRYQATAKPPTSYVPVDDPCVKKYIYDNYGGVLGFITEIGNLQQIFPSSNPNYLSSVQEGLIIADEKILSSSVPEAIGRALMRYSGGNLSIGYVTGSGLATFGLVASQTFQGVGAVMTPFATAAMSKARDVCSCKK